LLRLVFQKRNNSKRFEILHAGLTHRT
jgi:hypothetical protein